MICCFSAVNLSFRSFSDFFQDKYRSKSGKGTKIALEAKANYYDRCCYEVKQMKNCEIMRLTSIE